jgi:cell wall-associated NlpC family hydrolase
MTADDIVNAARECVGTPFRHQGRLLGVGLDCAGLALHAVQCCGVNASDFSGYGRTPNQGLLEASLDAQPDLERVLDITARQPGDILLMRFKYEPQHIAIYAGETLIHAYANAGKCCEHIIDDSWASRIVRVYRVKGLV